MTIAPAPTLPTPQLEEQLLLDGLTDRQRLAVIHERGPLLIIAGAGTGKTTVITRRIAWLIGRQLAKPSEILALTFTEKAAMDMQERVDILLPYGYTDVAISTFHAFGDRLLREHAVEAGLAPQLRVLSRAEQLVFLRQHLFELPLDRFRPLRDPARYVEALATIIGRAKDEAVTPEEFLDVAQRRRQAPSRDGDRGGTIAAAEEVSQRAGAATDQAVVEELAEFYAAYQRILRQEQLLDFGDQMLLAIQLFTEHPSLLAAYRSRFRYILVDEFQDTNFAQFRLLELLAEPTSNVTVVADDDQSIYKWRGAAISNVLKFLERYQDVRRLVLTENFRSNQAILDSAYRLIRCNDPDRLEVKEHIDKRLTAMRTLPPVEPTLAMLDTASSEADWVAHQIRAQLEAGSRRPGDFAILVRTNREADLFLRALNVCAIPWTFSGATGLFSTEEGKLLLSCLKTLSDPEDSLSAYHVISSSLYQSTMDDLVRCLAEARRNNRSLRSVLEAVGASSPQAPPVSDEFRAMVEAFLRDVAHLVELSRGHSPGQLLYRWLSDTGWLKRQTAFEQAHGVERLQTVAQFFDQLRRFEQLVGNRLPELMDALPFFQAVADAPGGEPEALSADRVNVLTIHKAKGLEFPVVFMVSLVQGRFPTTNRRDPIELPEDLIKDILPAGDYHLQEERRLFYVGMTRAKEQLYLTAAYDYGGRSVRKISQFVVEALSLSTAPPIVSLPLRERIERSRPPQPLQLEVRPSPLPEPLRLDAHGVDDYLTCPLKFRYSHALRLPIMRHHLVIYGSALHKAVEAFYTRQLAGQPIEEDELVHVFEEAWSSEGFLSHEHEQRRLAQGREVIRRFWREQQEHPERPSMIEEKFTFPLDDFIVTGRWDRVDISADGAVIIDYKSADVSDQAQADRRTRDSLQMGVYALAWYQLHGQLPHHVELRFLETGLTGRATLTNTDLERTIERLRETAAGIRALEFGPRPQEISCKWCAYQAICPASVV